MKPPSAIRRPIAGCRHRPAAADAAALRPALAGRPAGRDRARPALLGARLAVHALARPPGRLLALARHPQLQLLVRLGALHARRSSGSRSISASSGAASGAPSWSTSRRSRSSRFGHIAAMSGVQLVARHARGQAVRLVARRPAVGAPELRLGDDHLLGDRRPEPRRPLLPRVARSRAAHVAARDASWSRRSWRRCSSSSTRISCSTRCTRSRR